MNGQSPDKSEISDRGALFDALASTAADGVMVIDDSGVVQFYNQACGDSVPVPSRRSHWPECENAHAGAIGAEHDDYISALQSDAQTRHHRHRARSPWPSQRRLHLSHVSVRLARVSSTAGGSSSAPSMTSTAIKAEVGQARSGRPASRADRAFVGRCDPEQNLGHEIITS